MNKWTLLVCSLLITLFNSTYAFGQEQPELEQFFQENGITYKLVSEEDDEPDIWKIKVEQPIDHQLPEQGTFQQLVYVFHKGFDLPVNLHIQGYEIYRPKPSNWSDSLNSNEIYVEHRFCGKSGKLSDSLRQASLNLENIAHDYHHIYTLFKSIYQNHWFASGISKGGLTALAYRYYFPKDMAATLALSTSIKTTYSDTTFFNYIDQLALDGGCKEEIIALQTALFEQRNKIMPFMKDFIHARFMSYDYMGVNEVYTKAVLEIPFSLFQNGSGCQSLIEWDAQNPQSLFEALLKANHRWFMTDEVISKLNVYYYQAQTELSFYSYPTHRFSQYLHQTAPIPCIYETSGVTFDATTMLALKEWADHKANHIIYISGKNDPYSFRKVQPDSTLDVVDLWLPKHNHGQVYPKHLNSYKLRVIREKLLLWLE